MYSPLDVGSVAHFFASVAIVANMMTLSDVKEQHQKLTPLFACQVDGMLKYLRIKHLLRIGRTLLFMVSALAVVWLVEKMIDILWISFPFVGMMAMFSVRCAHKVWSTSFKYRPNNGKKPYYEDLLSLIVDQVEYCLVKHMLFLLDSFGLFPALRDHLTIHNEREWDVLIVFFSLQQRTCPHRSV